MAINGLSPDSYIIIGAGNFGAATALSLKKSKPHARVVLIDSAQHPSPRAASFDINKIVRDDYPDPLYMRIMVKAMDRWRTDPLYSPYFHQTGYLRADPSSFSRDSLMAYEKLGVEHGAAFLSVAEVRLKFPCFASTNFEGIDKVFWHPGAGWADAEKALKAVTEAALSAGVEYKQGRVQRLLINDSGACSGVVLHSSEKLHASSVLITIGASTAGLLASSAPTNLKVFAGDRVVAAGAISFYARLQGDQRQKFNSIPVLKSCLKHTKGEGMSMTPDGVIKFNCDLSFTNLQHQGPNKQEISLPPDHPDKYDWTTKFPTSLINRCRQTMEGLYGDEVRGIEIEAYRMCWDAETPYHDFLITPHPHVPRLSIATGGSFHGWKFLPVIGDCIVQMLDGMLPEEYAKRWAWDAEPPTDGHLANPTYRTETDLSKLLDRDDEARKAGTSSVNGLAVQQE